MMTPYSREYIYFEKTMFKTLYLTDFVVKLFLLEKLLVIKVNTSNRQDTSCP